MRRPLLLASSASAVLAAAVLLAGCTTPNPVTSPSPSGGTAGGSPSATTSAEPSASPSTSSTPVDIACDALITPQAMYDFNPNFSLLASWSSEAGTPAADAVAADGVACRWKNDTSGETIDISVAAPGDDALAARKSDAASGTSTSYGGAEGYFAVSGGVGEATAFEGPYWVVARSSYFAAPADAQSLLEGALSALS